MEKVLGEIIEKYVIRIDFEILDPNLSPIDVAYLNLQDKTLQLFSHDELVFVWFYFQYSLKSNRFNNNRINQDFAERTEVVAVKLFEEYSPWKSEIYNLLHTVGCRLNLFWNVNTTTLYKFKQTLEFDQRSQELHPIDWNCIKQRADQNVSGYKELFQYCTLYKPRAQDLIVEIYKRYRCPWTLLFVLSFIGWLRTRNTVSNYSHNTNLGLAAKIGSLDRLTVVVVVGLTLFTLFISVVLLFHLAKSRAKSEISCSSRDYHQSTHSK